MASKNIYLTGDCKWARVYEPDLKYKRWTIDVYPDAASWSVYEASGLDLKLREDTDGKHIKLSRPTMKLIKDKIVEFDPVEILKHDNTPMSTKTLIGNGSNVTCKVVVYDTVKGKGHRLEAVRVNELVEFQKDEVDTSNEDSPF